MTRRAPHAEALANLRAPLDEAAQAATDLGLMQAYAQGARLGDDESLTAIAAIRRRWGLDEEATVAAVRATLTRLAKPEAALRREVERLRAAQHAALHDPAWSDVVEAVHALTEARRPAEAARLEATQRDDAARVLHEALDAAPADDHDALAAWGDGLRELWRALEMPWPTRSRAPTPAILRASLPAVDATQRARTAATEAVAKIDAALDEVLG
jgi:hypothetical protein